MLQGIKSLVRRNPSVYRLVRGYGAMQQEREYLRLREFYYARAGDAFQPPGYMERSKQLLSRAWTPTLAKTDLRDVRIFAIVSNAWEHRTLTPVLMKDFDTVVFNYGALGYLEAAHCTGSGLRWRTELQQDILSAFTAAQQERPVDLVFAYGTHFHFAPETFQAMRRMGVPTALMCLDDKHSFLENPRSGVPNGQKPLIGAFDVHLTNSRETIRWYLAEGAPVFYFPEGCNPDLGADEDVPKDIDLSFVGKLYGFRGELVQSIRDAGIQIECFGPGWPNGPVSDDEMVRIYKRSRINLGMGGVGVSRRLTCLKGRDFDIPATGSLYLITYDAELARMFHIAREILCYHNEIDCVEQIRYYLERPDEALAIGQAGRERCLQQHTWTHRFRDLLCWMGVLTAETRVSVLPT